MTSSSAHDDDYSDSGEGDDEQQSNGGGESVSYSTSTTGALEAAAAAATTSVSYPVVYPPVAAMGAAMAQAAYPYPDPYYRSIFAPCDSLPYAAQTYPGHPMAQLQLMGIQQAGLPLPSDAVEEPIFVNAKQYHGILRRRQSRAKAESENKALKARKPYLHESRHLHALRRARGCGGRFVDAKKKKQGNGTADQKSENGSTSSEKSHHSSNGGMDKSRSTSTENLS